jgi:hypothetical protein
MAQDGPPQQPPPEGAHQKRPLPKPTNLQVFPKDMDPERLMEAMHHISGSLGVHCDYCHEIDETTHHPNFASDANPKKTTARLMIRMSREINEKYISQVNAKASVSCGTCHRGSPKPQAFVPPPEEHHGPMGPGGTAPGGPPPPPPQSK